MKHMKSCTIIFPNMENCFLLCYFAQGCKQLFCCMHAFALWYNMIASVMLFQMRVIYVDVADVKIPKSVVWSFRKWHFEYGYEMSLITDLKQ